MREAKVFHIRDADDASGFQLFAGMGMANRTLLIQVLADLIQVLQGSAAQLDFHIRGAFRAR